MQSAADAMQRTCRVILTVQITMVLPTCNIKAGGLCIVQDPDDAEVPIMPRSAKPFAIRISYSIRSDTPVLRNLELRT